MAEFLQGLAPASREHIRTLRSAGQFFWIDLSRQEATPEALREALEVPERALSPLLDFGATQPSRKLDFAADQVVFDFACFLTGEGEEALHPVDVHVMVRGDCLLTVHEEGVELTRELPVQPQEASELHVVYSVLDAMLMTAYDALTDVELAIGEMAQRAADLRGARVRLGTIRNLSARLSEMRRRLAPHRGTFERVSEETAAVRGLESGGKPYFERIYAQLNRLVGSIDAAADSLAELVNLRLNETIYTLTVVATIFLPLTFITGFFGMNFKWMTDNVESLPAFLALGIGGCATGALLAWLFVQRSSPIQADDDRVQHQLSAMRDRSRVRG